MVNLESAQAETIAPVELNETSEEVQEDQSDTEEAAPEKA